MAVIHKQQNIILNPGTRHAAYSGETYYGLPALKSSHYGWLVAAYFFIGGAASAVQFIATVVDLFGAKRDRPVVRAGRYIALAGAILSPVLLIADLHTPRRWYNMLRIYRRTSPMSIGSWALTIFGTFSGFTAVAQAAEDLFGWGIARWAARLFSLPAALAGGIVALYTGTLLAATNIPLWASAWPFLSSLFASAAASTASAVLILATPNAPRETRRRLTWFALFASSAELVLVGWIGERWRRYRAAAPLREAPTGVAWRFGVLGLGILAPLVVHAVEAFTGIERRFISTVAALATLVGGFTLRAVLIFAGKRSGQRAEDYFRFTQSS